MTELSQLPHVVLYREGGTLCCTWRKLPDTYDRAGADYMKASLETSGYKTIVRLAQAHADMGFPIGWEADLVDHLTDKIVITEHHSFWAMSPERYRSAA